MTIEFEWRIKSLVPARESDLPGMVGRVYFELLGTDTETGRSQGLQQSMKLEPPEGDFTPFEGLTEEQVKGWLAAHPKCEAFKSIVERSLNTPDSDPVQPVKDGSLPWQ